MLGGLGDPLKLLYYCEERSPPNSVASRSGEWILALPAPFLLPLRRLKTCVVPISTCQEGCVHELAFPGILEFGGRAGNLKVQPGLCGDLSGTARSPGLTLVMRCCRCDSMLAITRAHR